MCQSNASPLSDSYLKIMFLFFHPGFLKRKPEGYLHINWLLLRVLKRDNVTGTFQLPVLQLFESTLVLVSILFLLLSI